MILEPEIGPPQSVRLSEGLGVSAVTLMVIFGESMENYLDLPENLRKRILDSVDAAIASNRMLGSEVILIGGRVGFPADAARSQLGKLSELRGLVEPKTIQQS